MVLLMSATACGGNTPSDDTASTTTTTTTTTTVTTGDSTTTTASSSESTTTTTTTTTATTTTTTAFVPSGATVPIGTKPTTTTTTKAPTTTQTGAGDSTAATSTTTTTATTTTTTTVKPTEPTTPNGPYIVLPEVGSDIDVVKKKNRIRVSEVAAWSNTDGTIGVALTFRNYSSNWITEETNWVEYTCYDKNGNVVQKATKIMIGVIDTKNNKVKTFEFNVPAATAQVTITNSNIVYWTEWA